MNLLALMICVRNQRAQWGSMTELLPSEIAKKVRHANIEVHRQEAGAYDRIHSEIFNAYEQQRFWSDVRFIRDLIGKPCPTVLDIGCGTGNLALKFAQLGFYVLGIDVSIEMLQMLRAKNSSIPLICTDVEHFFSMSGEQYEVISFSSVLHHLANYMVVLELSLEHLSSNGVIYITHEPLLGGNRVPNWQKPIARISRPLRRRWFSLRGMEIPTIDYSLSDIHLPTGLNDSEIVSLLEDYSCQVVKKERYVSTRLGIVYGLLITSKCFKRKANAFSLIGQRI